MKENKYFLLTQNYEEVLSNAIDQCLMLFSKSNQTNENIIITNVGQYLIDLVDKGDSVKIPAVTDNIFVRSMGLAFTIRFDKDKLALISLVKFILTVADKAFAAENNDHEIEKIVGHYDLD
ncbi:hypothetical protein [Lactobacillus kefiranofaciens]|uniref:Uncharacterized protein n=1 Tax=Lactobacillus kefiranofaciens TaxID=267818 RepID=A0AAX3UDF5_9LACO|nr:hypothetical protein [Lactobacillus kefiranofaciens]AEG41643.1 hypothetical protein WANG_p1040 [Lactobacillus kefiranofaciens subsp. kefiranofaciens]KRM20462.1 hypothetical protein FC93_GL001624 [Lactobacillus kefiranofaciens subsp. kefiranofaciens DSM 5016 = JCM 6985]QFQ68451.1 hypothetical protein LKK75_08740 [Lactobacillus kefiranofaciens subsp. kefiranofaciens]WGO85752.1 hypothetical protein QEJ78_10665 [Lactobacillus kefiranofaciens]WQH36925.1 hypothetical protein U2870_04785 [Lactobac